MIKIFKKFVLVLLSMLMLFACGISIYGIWFYLTDKSSARAEGLMMTGYATVYSSLVFVVYLIGLFWLRRELSKNFVVLTLLPFALMLVLTAFAALLGTPW